MTTSSPTTPATPALGNRLGLRVNGTPIPQGSKTANRFGNGVRDANAKTLKPWREHIATQAADQLRYHDLPLLGPIRIWVHFTFTRPPSHYRSGRNAHLLKDGAPTFPGHSCGDLDKLQRAILDALTTPTDGTWPGVWLDDTQVVDIRARKFYAGEDEHALDQPGVTVVIEALEPQAAPA